MLDRRKALVIGATNLLTAAIVVFGVFRGLPARWWPVDTAAGVLAALELTAAIGLWRRARWAIVAARASAATALALGLFTATVLAVTASWLSGIYGPVGRGGAVVLALVAALVLPYLVALPAAQLLWLRPGGDEPAAPAARGPRSARP